ncbi:MAG: hypothetical protein ABSH08_13850 [Tepidisphaeraceae bacterium]|jgi:hypothetical protein
MPTIVDYQIVLDRLTSQGLECHYYNGGSFGFGPAAEVRGWIGPPDGTIRPELDKFARRVAAPFGATLAGLAVRAWRQVLAGNVWVMPASNWSYELNHGSREWLPGLLGDCGIDFSLLIGRTNAAAIEFLPGEEAGFEGFVGGLLAGLTTSDFALAFPGRAAVCTVHHHQQLWWVTNNRQLAMLLDGID